ncbi:MAG: hypothetical protein GKS06_08945 [Acidobacteria bacterium]|nr:hypothetical protein [Acidobacteriota bacterium]
MKRLALTACLLTFAFAVGASSRAAEAAAPTTVAAGSMCTCVEPKRPTCEVWWQTSAIFSGRVTRIDTVTEEANGESIVKNLVNMRVQERWRGLQGQREVVIATGTGGGDCGFQFETNQTYLVYANQSASTGRYETGICSRTALIDEAAADMAFLQGIETADPVVELYGMVYRERQSRMPGDDPDRRLDPGGPLPEIGVTLTDAAGQVHETSSDIDGWYELGGLAAGRYELTLSGESVDETSRWRLRIPVAPACIWRNIIVRPTTRPQTSSQQR